MQVLEFKQSARPRLRPSGDAPSENLHAIVRFADHAFSNSYRYRSSKVGARGSCQTRLRRAASKLLDIAGDKARFGGTREIGLSGENPVARGVPMSSDPPAWSASPPATSDALSFVSDPPREGNNGFATDCVTDTPWFVWSVDDLPGRGTGRGGGGLGYRVGGHIQFHFALGKFSGNGLQNIRPTKG
jgi:hypothetical protein